MIAGINESTALIIGVCTALTLLAAGYKVLWHGKRLKDGRRSPGWIKGFLQDVRGFRDAILGREAVVDSITREVIQPPLPGIGMRMAHQETQMTEMTRAVTQLAETHTQMAEVRTEVKELGTRVSKLEEAVVERIVTKVESAAAWRAVEAASLATPDQIADEDPDLS